MRLYLVVLVSISASTIAPLSTVQADEISPKVRIQTNLGDIVVELNKEKAPQTVANFLSYVNDGFYNGTVFHRVIDGFMIQGGGFTEDLQQKATKSPIQNEADNGLKNDRGTLAMARTSDPDSATSQFFINHVDNKPLDFDGPYAPGYAVFGKVIKGMEVVDAIAAIPTKAVGPHANVPVEAVVIESVKVMEKAEPAEEAPKETVPEKAIPEKSEE